MNEELTKKILISLRELRKETQTLLEEQSKLYNISVTQLLILDALNKHEACSLHELATKVNLSPSTTSETVEKMVQMSYLSRRQSERNRRAVEITLTEKGQAVLKQTFSSWFQDFSILEELGEERLIEFYETQQAIIEVLKKRRELSGK